VSEPLIVYWSSNSGHTKALADKLEANTVELADYDGTSPYVLMCPTYDQPHGGFTPKPVQTFLEKHAHLMVGVVGVGNRAFGAHYCQAAHGISAKYGVPVLWRVEIMGTEKDYVVIDHGINQHWAALASMRLS